MMMLLKNTKKSQIQVGSRGVYSEYSHVGRRHFEWVSQPMTNVDHPSRQHSPGGTFIMFFVGISAIVSRNGA